MEPLRNLALGGRARRIGPSQQTAIAKAVEDEPGVRSVQHFLASTRIWSRRRMGCKVKDSKGKRKLMGRGCDRVEARCGQYLRTSHRDLRSAKHYWFTTDGVRAGKGCEFLNTAVGDPHSAQHAWAIPKVRRGVKKYIQGIYVKMVPTI